MNKEAKILGNQEEQKGIERLLEQAGQDKVIDGVIRGEDPEKKYKGIMLFRNKTIKFYTEDDELDYNNDFNNSMTRYWHTSPLTRRELLENVRRLYGRHPPWVEDWINTHLEKEKPVIGFYSHASGGLAEIAEIFEKEGIPIESRGCICYEAENLTKASGKLPKIAIINPSSSIRGCWVGLKEIIETNPETQFYIPLYGLGPKERREGIGFHLNLTYIHTSNESEEIIQKLLRKYKQHENEQRS